MKRFGNKGMIITFLTALLLSGISCSHKRCPCEDYEEPPWDSLAATRQEEETQKDSLDLLYDSLYQQYEIKNAGE